jgi:MoaA/NifB/PqqE/SkfB family radical SAM enzyme
MIHDNEPTDQTEEHLIKIVDFCKGWGVQSFCAAGGGEPLISSGTMGMLERIKYHNLDVGLITNGSLLTDEKIKIIAASCRWVGVSVDAATDETFNHVKGLPQSSGMFQKVIDNIRKLGKAVADNETDLCMKFLIHPDNCNEIYGASLLAKQLGCKGIHIRPCGITNLTVTKGKEISFKGHEKTIDEQIEKAHELSDDHFQVYAIRHKFNPDFSPLRKFKRCWAIPMTPTFGADGWMHTCFDMRGRDDLRMCKHNPDPFDVLKFWNTPAHHELIKNIDIDKCCRCTFSLINEGIEKAIIKDKMIRNFP